jgi:hypothetical protein
MLASYPKKTYVSLGSKISYIAIGNFNNILRTELKSRLIESINRKRVKMVHHYQFSIA